MRRTPPLPPALPLLLALVLLLTGCQEQSPPQTPEPVRLGLALQPTSALVMVALEQGLLEREGLQVTVTDYPSGKRALGEGLAIGAEDVVTTMAVPVVALALERDDFRILGVTARVDGLNRVVARRDRGIRTPADLRGKRVATQKLSGLHYYLHLFLQEHYLSEPDLEMVYPKVEELPELLARGEVDAVVVREPYTTRTLSLLGEGAVVFDQPGLVEQKDLLVASRDLLERRPRVATRLLRGLLAAEEFAHAHPDRVAALVAGRLGIPVSLLAPHFRSPHQLRVTLSEVVHVRLEEQTRWMIRDGYLDPRPLPDFQHLIAVEPLLGLRPQRVTLIR